MPSDNTLTSAHGHPTFPVARLHSCSQQKLLLIPCLHIRLLCSLNSCIVNWPHFIGLPVGGAGFEPAKAVPSDLQSDPFDRSGNPPIQQTKTTPQGPAARNQRTSAIGPTLTIKLPPMAQKLPTPARWLLTDNFTPHHYSFVY